MKTSANPDKIPYMKLSVGLFLKDAPKSHRGTISETWTFGIIPQPFSKLIASVVFESLNFYANAFNPTAENINSDVIIVLQNIYTSE